MPPPRRDLPPRDFEVDLGSERSVDYRGPRSRSRGLKIAGLVVGTLLCLAVGIGVGYFTGRDESSPAATGEGGASEPRDRAAGVPPARLSEAERTVQNRLGAVALDQAGTLVAAAVARGREQTGASAAGRSPEADQPERDRDRRSRHRSTAADERSRTAGPLEQRLAPLLNFEQYDPYRQER